MIYKYTIEAFNESPMGKLDAVSLVVYASDDDSAVVKASAIKHRGKYEIRTIEELDQKPELKKKD